MAMKFILLLFTLIYQLNSYGQYNDISSRTIKDTRINIIYEWIYSVDTIGIDSIFVDYSCYQYNYDTLGVLTKREHLKGNDSLIKIYYSDTLDFLINKNNRYERYGIMQAGIVFPWRFSTKEISKICYEYDFHKKIVSKLYKDGTNINTVFNYGFYIKSENDTVTFLRAQQFYNKFDTYIKYSYTDVVLPESVVATVDGKFKTWIVFDYVFYPPLQRISE